MKNFGTQILYGNFSIVPRKIYENSVEFSVSTLFETRTFLVVVSMGTDKVSVYSGWETDSICKGVIRGTQDKQLFITMLLVRDNFLELEKRSEQEYNLGYEKLLTESCLKDPNVKKSKKKELLKILDKIEFLLLSYKDKDLREAIEEVDRIAPSANIAQR